MDDHRKSFVICFTAMMQDPYFVASNLFQAVGFYNFISEFFWGPNFNWTGCNLCAKPVFAFL